MGGRVDFPLRFNAIFQSASFRFFVRAMYASLFAGQILPSGIGVDAVRLALLWQQKVPLRSGLPSLAIDRAAGVSAIIVLMWFGWRQAVEGRVA